MICNSNDETNFRHKLLLADGKAANLYKTIGNNELISSY